MKVDGKGRRKILICGEAPGSDEDQQGIPFVGKMGQFLQEELDRVGIDMREDCWITNSARCRPPDNKYPPRTVDYCRPYLIQAVKELKPEIILLLGNYAVQSLLGWLWRESPGSVSTWAGLQIPNQKINAWICPTYHPSFIKRSENDSDKGEEAARTVFHAHLKAMSELKGRPWQEIPDYNSGIRLIRNESEASIAIRKMIGKKPVAFDYETDRLKPDSREAEIVCCSLSDGENTISFPWRGFKVIETMEEFLKSNTPKIASNLKFEDRWTRRIFGFPVRNWAFDTMLAAHVLDQRKGVTSIKFQAFAMLGFDAWDSEVKEYLKAKTTNGKNRIRELDWTTLLKYNALDSLLEWQVAKIQAKKLGTIP